jgi:hypothetical protein
LRRASCHDHALAAADRHVSASLPDQGLDHSLPAGAYEIVTDEETIEGLLFSAWRRIATIIIVPAEDARNSTEMLRIGSVDLADAQRIDASVAND